MSESVEVYKVTKSEEYVKCLFNTAIGAYELQTPRCEGIVLRKLRTHQKPFVRFKISTIVVP